MKSIALAIAIAVVIVCLPSRADAYAWMIRHEYTGCNQCHADPSGGGLLTAYGRAQGELLLRTQYGGPIEDPGKVGNFLFGAIDLPDSVLLGGDLRYLYYNVKSAGTPSVTDHFLMQSDFEAQVAIDRVRANASVGYAEKGALPASITRAPEHNAVSRVHWLGVDIGEEHNWVLRAGRMNLPFGIRSIEHTMFVRSESRTDINSAQQHGVALAYNGEKWRGELMAIAGNFQVAPDAFRERGYSAYLEWSPVPQAAIGASSLITHAEKDLQLQTALWRHAHGAFARWAPFAKLVLLTEGDLLLNSQPPTARYSAINAVGFAAMLQADLEVIQGIHVMATGELRDLAPPPGQVDGMSYAGWGTFAWFFAPHADVRLDAVLSTIPAGATHTSSTTLLAQLHLFL